MKTSWQRIFCKNARDSFWVFFSYFSREFLWLRRKRNQNIICERDFLYYKSAKLLSISNCYQTAMTLSQLKQRRIHQCQYCNTEMQEMAGQSGQFPTQVLTNSLTLSQPEEADCTTCPTRFRQLPTSILYTSNTASVRPKLGDRTHQFLADYLTPMFFGIPAALFMLRIYSL